MFCGSLWPLSHSLGSWEAREDGGDGLGCVRGWVRWICSGASNGKFWEVKGILGGKCGGILVLAGSGNSGVVRRMLCRRCRGKAEAWGVGNGGEVRLCRGWL